jgi:tellurite resistance protein TehA-like permease
MSLIGADWGVGQVLLTIVWLALFFIWIMLLLSVFADIFRSHDLSGPAKALWIIFVVLFPYLGVFAYLVIRGRKMSEHALEDAQHNEAAVQSYIRRTAGGGVVDELHKLADLRDRGVIDEAEFQSLKTKIMADA